MDEMAFQQALAKYNKEFDEAEPFNNWYPPDNDYTVMISGVTRGVTKESAPFWKIMATIISPDHEDLNEKEFTLAFLSNKMFGKMKTICNQLAQDTSKRKIEDYDKEIDGYVGSFLNVRVHREKAVKSGNMYVAVDIIEIIPSTEVVPPAENQPETT